jgi:hypothetical protein
MPLRRCCFRQLPRTALITPCYTTALGGQGGEGVQAWLPCRPRRSGEVLPQALGVDLLPRAH